MRPDKLLELPGTQFRWNLLPRLALGHFDLQSLGILADSSGATGIHAPWTFQPILPLQKTRNQLLAFSFQKVAWSSTSDIYCVLRCVASNWAAAFAAWHRLTERAQNPSAF
jgi:hypothetical protein